MAKDKKFGVERRDEAAKWTSEMIGCQDFAEDHTRREPGTFEKGPKPGTDSTDEVHDLAEGC